MLNLFHRDVLKLKDCLQKVALLIQLLIEKFLSRADDICGKGYRTSLVSAPQGMKGKLWSDLVVFRNDISVHAVSILWFILANMVNVMMS